MVIIFLSVMFLSRTLIVQACEPLPDYWFAERYEFGPVNLPETIDLVQSPPDVAQGYFQISNHSDSPLYVLPMDSRASLVVTAEPSITGEGLTQEQTTEEILLIERAPDLATFVIEAGKIFTLDNESFPTLVPYIEERNVLDFSRPAFFFLPITQRGEFLLVFDDQLITVPFTISYAINENFTPEICGEDIESSTQQEIEFASEADYSVLISAVAFGVILLVSLGSIVGVRKLTTDESTEKTVL